MTKDFKPSQTKGPPQAKKTTAHRGTYLGRGQFGFIFGLFEQENGRDET